MLAASSALALVLVQAATGLYVPSNRMGLLDWNNPGTWDSGAVSNLALTQV